ncbi:Heterokaryon incompatibility protein (HET) domain containing protein [Rhypophila decipiens]
MNRDRDYQYQKLENDESIRLLEIQPGTAGETVRGRLRPAAFRDDYGCVRPESDFPKDHLDQRALQVLRYDAVSWAWGDPVKNAHVELLDKNGERWTFSISRKLEEALQAVRDLNSARTIWIDAICINQSDDFEKSHQVPMMDRIYGLADKVYVWLGPKSQTHDAEIAFAILRKIRKDMDYKKTIEGSDVEHLRALSHMMRRDWFSRRWVIQEIALAKKAVVFCDKESMDWVEFAQAIELFVEGESKTQLADNVTLKKTHITHFWKNVSSLGAARLVRDISSIRRLAPNTRSRFSHELLMSLEEIVCRLETFKTSKPHDTIYAYLALAKDTVPLAHLPDNAGLSSKLLQAARVFDMSKIAAKAFIVDYKQPYSEVCSQFIQFAVKQQSDRQTALDILCRPWSYEEEVYELRKEIHLPQWVTTIASAPFEMTEHDSTIGSYRRNGDPFVGPPGKPIYNAADSTPVKDRHLKFLKFQGMDGNPVYSLITTGFVLDTVDIIKDKVTTEALVPEEWLTLGQWHDKTQPPPNELLRTLVADRGPGGISCPLSYPLCCATALKKSVSLRNLETSTITRHPDLYDSFVAEFCTRVQEVVVNRRLIRTKTHQKLGLVSGREFVQGGSDAGDVGSTIRAGDLICILHGCSVPVVLRKVKKPRAQIEHEKKEYDKLLEKPACMVQRRWREILRSRRESRTRDQSSTAQSKNRSDDTTAQSDDTRSNGSNLDVVGSSSRGKRKSPGTTSARRSRRRTTDKNSTRGGPSEGSRSASAATAKRAEDFRPRFEKEYYYQFWGECYVDGMMDGVAVRVQNEQNDSNTPDKMPNIVFDLR